ncbi:MAG: TRAP transporter substrate-binding protein [Campylobacteraceae bacterium]|nr:TRAP transporter substrate-binding protein [Campylobacteraceae bacterium]
MNIKNLAVTGLVSLSICATSVAAAEKKVLLKVPTTFSTNLIGLGTPLPAFKKGLESISSTLKVKIYEPKKLVAPFEILDAVSSGKVNAGWSTAGYWKGKMPAAAIFSSVPFGPEAPEFFSWLYKGNGLKLYQKMYDDAKYNVHVLPCSISSPETAGWYKKEINSPEDLKGLKMRFFGLGGDVMTKLGASISLLPGGEIFSALEKGVIDASEFSMPVVDQLLGFYKIAKFNYFPGWHQQATVFELLINNKTWNKMSNMQQSAIEMTCKANMTDSLAESEAVQGAVIKENIENRGVIVKKWSPEMLDAFKGAWKEALVDLKQDETFNTVWSDLEKFRADYSYWSKLAFLPR